jgi:predicted flap endonuclease-1-like 5' DNA nuclease
MLYVFENFWVWLVLALIVGAIVGWLTWSRASRAGWFAGWATWGAIAFVVGLVVALLRLIPGRGGLWLETALLSFFVYIVGCFVGGWLKSLFEVKAAVERPVVAAPVEPAAPVAAAPTPPPAPPLPDEDDHEGLRPQGYATARGGVPDDLKLIRGVGHQNEARLHGLGVWHFDQIARWTPENVKWVSSYLAFPGRIEREHWIEQAKELAAGVITDFAKRVEAGLVKTSLDDGTLGQSNIEKVKPRT